MSDAKFYFAYTYTFWRLRRWLKSDFDFNKSWGAWKALLVISVLEANFLLSIYVLVEVLLERQIFSVLPKMGAFIVSAAIVFLNHWMLMREARWKRFEKEFLNLELRTHVMFGFAIVGAIIFVIMTFVFVVYWVSQISWDKPPIFVF